MTARRGLPGPEGDDMAIRMAFAALLRYAEEHGTAIYSADMRSVRVHEPGCPGRCGANQRHALTGQGPGCAAVVLELDGAGRPIKAWGPWWGRG